MNISEEEMDLAIKLNTSFVHIKRSANEIANGLAKERVGRPDMVIQIFAVYFLVAAVFCFWDLLISSSIIFFYFLMVSFSCFSVYVSYAR